MARTLSATAVASMHAQETGEVWLLLLTISHATLGTPLRFVNNNEDITSNGNVYTAFPFEIILPTQDPDQPPTASLRIDNVDRSIIAVLRTLTSPPTIQFDVILASAPNTVEMTFPGMQLRSATYNAATIEGEIAPEPIFAEPVTYSMTPSRFPGMF